jgi:hypothetical protein
LRKAPPTLKVKTSFSIVASGATELSGCDSSAEVATRRTEGEGKMMPAGPVWTPHEDERLRALALSAASVATIARQMNRSEAAVRKRRQAEYGAGQSAPEPWAEGEKFSMKQLGGQSQRPRLTVSPKVVELWNGPRFVIRLDPE